MCKCYKIIYNIEIGKNVWNFENINAFWDDNARSRAILVTIGHNGFFFTIIRSLFPCDIKLSFCV